MQRGSLTVVGTGIQLGLHVTAETRAELERAGELLHLVTEPAARVWLESLNPRARSLHPLYEAGRPRADIYARLVEEIVAAVRRGGAVCAAFYGHPGVFAFPAHEAVRRARSEGFPARMLPAVSAADCLFADLGVDPAIGFHSYEATDFLLHGRNVDPTAALILWQVTLVGETKAAQAPSRQGVRVLAERLARDYGPGHEVVLYEASVYPVAEPAIQRLALGELAQAELPRLATLYVPPLRRPVVDREMAERLGASGVDGRRVQERAQRAR